MPSDSKRWSRDSWLAAGGRPHSAGEALNSPLVPASTYELGGETAYSRDDGTPTWRSLEELVGGLEGGRALAFSSGMAAIHAVFDQLPTGARIAWPEDCYQGVTGLIDAGRHQRRWTATALAIESTDDWVAAAAECDLLWLESPSNPLLGVADLDRIGAAARESRCWLAVDNTLATPLNQRPLERGADLVVHSATKSIGGHSDLLCGLAVTRDPELHSGLKKTRELAGATPGTLETYLATRGARTLAVRLERAQASALEVARRLEAHPEVVLVRYPGLPSHPTHETARDQLDGFCTVISFDVEGVEFAERFLGRLELVRHATSFGGVESSVERRAAVPGQEHLPPGLLRLSVGIEQLEDLWSDLQQALQP